MTIRGRNLAGIREPLDRVLTWAGVFVLVFALGPVAVQAHELVWPVTLFDEIAFLSAWFVVVAGGLVLVALGTVGRPSPLTRSVVATLVVLAVGGATMASRALGDGLLVLVPIALHATAPLFVVGIGLAAAAVRWRTGIEGLARPRPVALLLAAAASALVVFFWPSAGGPVAARWIDAAAVAVASTTFEHRRAAITQLVLASLPIGLVAFAAWRALRTKGTTSSATGWVLALTPSVLATLGFKGAAAFGDDAYVLLGLRSAALFLALSATLAFAVSSALMHLADPIGADVHHPTHLVRDEVLFRALLTSADGPPDFVAATAGYRSTVRRLVADRFAALFAEIAREHSHLAPYVVVRDDLLRQLAGDGDAPPRASRLAKWLAARNRLELVGSVALIAVALVGAGTLHLGTPRATPWPLDSGNAWGTALYRDLLPRLAIAATHSSPSDHRLLDEVTSDAIDAADDVPELADAIRRLGRAARDVGGRHRLLVRAGEDINVAARAAGVPFYVDVNVIGRRGEDGNEWMFYLKTYRIRRTRIARLGDASYAALWLERLDRTNVVERQLGWTKRDQPRGMVILDVVRDYWRDDLAPVLAGNEHRFYGRYGALLRADLERAIARHPRAPKEASLSKLLECIEAGELGDDEGWRTEPVLAEYVDGAPAARAEEDDACTSARQAVEPIVIELLAEKVEVHELQHVVDGGSPKVPESLRAKMRGYSEASLGFATAELSAYLAEIARSNLPRLALVHFLALGAQSERSPESFAARVAEETIVEGGSTPNALILGPEDELRAAAEKAHARLFGRSLGVLDLSAAPQRP